jgi:hypothetical protein
LFILFYGSIAASFSFGPAQKKAASGCPERRFFRFDGLLLD